ncbi:MAG: hypothetical protein GC190_05185 [Alphaproteobacteria bacterium]|nr:hypothetical protein [Alphaproteobacteria bacterium]
MKKILFATATAAALTLGFAGAPVSAAPGFNASQYCKSIGDAGYSHGDCTSIVTKVVNKSGSDDAAAFCQDLKLEFPDFFDATYKNLGDCVSSFHKS